MNLTLLTFKIFHMKKNICKMLLGRKQIKKHDQSPAELSSLLLINPKKL